MSADGAWLRGRRSVETAIRHEPGPIGGSARWRRYGMSAMPSATRSPRSSSSAIASPAPPLDVGGHERGLDARGGQRADDGAGGRAGDDVGVAGAPARLGLERLEGSDEPRAAYDASGSEHKSYPHRIRP